MKISITHPYYFILIPIVFALLIYSGKWLRMKNKIRKNILIVLHGLVITCLLFAISGIHVQEKNSEETTIFLLDISDSVASNKEEMITFVNEALKDCPKKGKVGIVAFGDEAKVEQFVSNKLYFSEFQTTPLSTCTNIEKAVQTAMAMFQGDTGKRLVLITDGNENVGNITNLTYSITGNKVDFQVLKIENKIGKEAYVEGVKVSETVNVGDTFNVVVTVQSNTKTTATLSLYQEEQLKKKEKVELQTGKNTFVFKDKLTESGLKTYRAFLEPVEDGEKINNSYATFTQAKESEKVLIIEGKRGQGEEFSRLMDSINVNYELRTPDEVFGDLKSLMNYKAIITLDVYADDLSKEFMKSLPNYVKEYGGGFIAVGGENSYALGGYRNTSIEEVLPVSMDLTGEKQIPEMAIVYVIDRSSSMAGTENTQSALDLALEATEEALNNMREIDQVGVLVFDDAYSWAVPIQKLSNKENIVEVIDSIGLGGGTSIYPAVEEAAKQLQESQAPLKHIILLSDGMDNYALGHYDSVIELMKKEDITLSTVSIGDGADTYLMGQLAQEGNGRSYAAVQGESLPRIFAQEVYLSTKSYLNHREFTPVINNNYEILAGVTEQGMPSILGYISTSAKELATVHISSDTQEPILASWRYGLGKTIAFTTDGENKWTANFANWANYGALWKNMISYVIMQEDDSQGKVEVEQVGNNAHISYTTDNYNKNSQVVATYTDESGNTKELILDAIGVGKYEGNIQFTDIGVHMLNITQKEGEQIISAKNTAIAMQYSTEYRYLEENNTLDSFVEMVNGTRITKPSQVFSRKLDSVYGNMDTTNFWLMIACILFFLMVVYSRLQIDRLDRWIENLGKKPVQKGESRESIVENTISTKDKKINDSKSLETEIKQPITKKQRKNKKNEKKQEAKKMEEASAMLLKKKRERE